MDELVRMKELIQILDEASRAYYQEGREIMPNERYDKLYDELLSLEEKTGTVLAGSPTQKVGYEVLSELPKEHHEEAALSLDKTKEIETLQSFLGAQSGVLSWKLDGLTVVLTYEGGELLKAVTRGNGEIGEVVTGNARTFVNLPLRIPFTGHLVLRGEAVIRYSDFNRMNEEIEEESKYKNPRNLASGSVRQLDPKVTKTRSVNLIAFALIEAEGFDSKNSFMEQMAFLDRQGFETVERVLVTSGTLPEAVHGFAEKVKQYDVPSDGLVLVMDDLAYGRSLGRTAKFPRNAMAFKWRDEMAETELLAIEWSASRTGLLNPVAIFRPVELEGTTVSRALVHNISVMEELGLSIGDRIRVYKANMIIPQISVDLTAEELKRAQQAPLPRRFDVPATCPVCGEATEIRDEEGVRTLFCTNPDCPAKRIKRFELFVSRNAMNIEGLSEMTMEKLISEGLVHHFGDLYRLREHRAEIAGMEGFGEISADNLLKAIEAAREVPLERLLTAISIPGIGVAGGKMLSRAFRGDLNALCAAGPEELAAIENVGEITARDIVAFFRDPKKSGELDDLLTEITLKEQENTQEQTLEGKTFVVTGAVHHFENRDALKAFIEARGGKVTGSVTKNTDYLINNDVNSNSTKNKTARSLGIPVISEEEFLNL
ncbi:MAG: NAD-dependent DNA ligase LigA [Lachnospiraceae bacterium]|nr:NAD-dependent DNA ligase LigA [Lachnospiraceae bacterium]